MAGRIIYLEIDDEITTAAARIRDADEARIAIVLPHGSRVATSRINFRLLSRDALTHEKRLSIVAADAATRALAASAGLPVFGSVAEYEAAERGLDEADAAAGLAVATGVVGAVGAARIAEGEAESPKSGAAGAPEPGTNEPEGPEAEPAGEPDGTLGLVVPAVAAGAAARTSPARVETGSQPPPRPEAVAPVAGTSGTASAGVIGSRRIRTPWLIGGAILVLALLIGGVGLYVLLPSATIVVTPRPEPVTPVELTVVADPAATQPDAVARVVPAQEITIPVSVNDEFPATGKRVELTRATGTVRFENRDPTSTNRIDEGSIVRTASGVRFRIDAQLVVPRAELVGLTIFPARASVKVTAVDGGPEGNVEPGTIVIVPPAENGLFLKVTNPEATTGGSREEFTRVTQQDVDGALAALDTSLHAAFDEAMADPALTAGGATVFPSTGVLGPTTPTVPPETLVGQEVASFALGLSATGTVVAVDTAPVQAIAEAQLQGAVEAGHTLVPGSADIEVGEAVVVGQTVSFPVTVIAEQVAVLDPAQLTSLVLGKPVDEARALLEPYGDVEMTVSPDWSGSVPGFESRVDLTVANAVEIESPAPSGSATP